MILQLEHNPSPATVVDSEAQPQETNTPPFLSAEAAAKLGPFPAVAPKSTAEPSPSSKTAADPTSTSSSAALVVEATPALVESTKSKAVTPAEDQSAKALSTQGPPAADSTPTAAADPIPANPAKPSTVPVEVPSEPSPLAAEGRDLQDIPLSRRSQRNPAKTGKKSQPQAVPAKQTTPKRKASSSAKAMAKTARRRIFQLPKSDTEADHNTAAGQAPSSPSHDGVPSDSKARLPKDENPASSASPKEGLDQEDPDLKEARLQRVAELEALLAELKNPASRA